MHNKKLIRIIAIVLVVLLVGGVVVGALFSALAEQPTGVGADRRHQCELTMEYLVEEQALHISQRLVYYNDSEHRLDSVVFYAAGNMFRRESALMYGDKDLDKVFFAGYAPADAPQYVAVAVVEAGKHGSSVAAPIVGEILAHVLSHPINEADKEEN